MDALDYLPAALLAVAPRVLFRSEWETALKGPMRTADLTTDRRVAMFLGQCSEESGGFLVLVENLNYSAVRLIAAWPARFNQDSSKLYSQRPAAIANRVYADRMGNGNEASGDGWRFRGGGILQITGRSAWTRFGATVSRSPEDAWTWAQTREGAAASACWFWTDRGRLNDLSDNWRITECTKRINGGLTGLQERITLCNAALHAISGPVDPVKPVKPMKPVLIAESSADDLNAAEQARIKRDGPTIA